MPPSDSFQQMQEKMSKWIKNGVRPGWLIYPEQQLTYIYKTDGTVSKVAGFNNTLSGEDVPENFSFDMKFIIKLKYRY